MSIYTSDCVQGHIEHNYHIHNYGVEHSLIIIMYFPAVKNCNCY